MVSQSVCPSSSEHLSPQPAPRNIRNTIGVTPGMIPKVRRTNAGKTSFDNPGGYLFIFTYDGMVLECNGVFTSCLGYRRRDIIGRSLGAFIAQEGFSGFTAAANMARLGGGKRVDTIFRCKNGEPRTLAVTIHSFRTEKGKFLLAETSPIQEPADESLFARQFRTSPFPTLVWRKWGAGFVLDCYNAAAETFWGMRFNPSDGETAERFFATWPKITGILERCYRDRKRMETVIVHPVECPAPERRIHLIFDFSPPDRVLVYAEDIAAGKEQEERVAACRHLLRSLSAELTLAEENQRMLIAADLHDSVNQTLAAAQFKLEELEEEIPSCGTRVRDIRLLVEKTIREARGLSFELSPPVLRESGFEAAVKWLAERFERDRGITTRVQCEPQPGRLPADMEMLLFRALRELLHNTYKHARARNTCVSVWSDRVNVYVAVEDDGTGFDPSSDGERKERTGGFGLFGIRERLRYLGGDMTIESSHSMGTRCILRAPFEKRSSHKGVQ